MNGLRKRIPEGWEVSIINARGMTMRSGGIHVVLYELRAYDPREPYGRLIRKRRSGYNPIVLDSITSGHGIPVWMDHVCKILNKQTHQYGFRGNS